MPTRYRRTILPLALLVLSGLAATASATDKYKIVNEGGIREDWAAADGAKFNAPGYPAAFASRGDDVCLAMGYAIKEDGTTDDFAIVKAWSSSRGEDEPATGFWQAFGQAGAVALADWKFKPRVINGAVPTYTVATLMFQGKGAVTSADLRSHCAVNDLRTAVQQKQADKFMRGSEKRLMDSMAQRVRHPLPQPVPPPRR
jgi:hypothetical protein